MSLQAFQLGGHHEIDGQEERLEAAAEGEEAAASEADECAKASALSATHDIQHLLPHREGRTRELDAGGGDGEDVAAVDVDDVPSCVGQHVPVVAVCRVQQGHNHQERRRTLDEGPLHTAEQNRVEEEVVEDACVAAGGEHLGGYNADIELLLGEDRSHQGDELQSEGVLSASSA